MFRLNGKVALVSGAARGIGAAIAQTMADEGAQRSSSATAGAIIWGFENERAVA
jgi:NAD(P)-dependent dehydrogenase (short-subunit alcohol dehydrogenase family)